MKKLIVLFGILFIGFSGFSQLNEDDKLRFDENFFEAIHFNLKEDYQKSNEYYEQCLAINPDSDVVYFKMAQNYFYLKDYEKAEFYVLKAQQINKENKWYQHLFIKIQIAKGLEKKKLYKLIEDYKKIVKNKYVIRNLYREIYKQQPKVTYQTPKPKVKTTGFDALYRQKQYDRIVAQAEKILDRQPDDALAYWWMAKAKTGLKKYNEALDYLDMGIDFVLNNKTLLKKYYQQYIIIYQAKNQLKKARKYQEKLQKI